jgi:hypothetical protein
MLLANRLRVPAARALRQARAGSRRAAPGGSSARLASTSAPTNGGGASLPVLVAVGAGSVLAGYLLAPRAAPAQAQTVVDAAHAPPPTDSVPSFGSPDDFRKAIDELRAAFGGDGDAVTTDEDVLKSKGFSENDYHPGALCPLPPCAFTTDDTSCRRASHCRRVPSKHRGCREGRKYLAQVPHAHHPILRWNESRGTHPRRTFCLCSKRIACLTPKQA